MAPTKWLITVSSQSHVQSGDEHRSRSVGCDSPVTRSFLPSIHSSRKIFLHCFLSGINICVCVSKLRPLLTTSGSNQLYKSTYRLWESNRKHNSKKNIFPDLLHRCKWTSSTCWSCCTRPCWQISICANSPGVCSFDKWGLSNGKTPQIHFPMNASRHLWMSEIRLDFIIFIILCLIIWCPVKGVRAHDCQLSHVYE